MSFERFHMKHRPRDGLTPRVIFLNWKYARELRNMVYGASWCSAWTKPDALYYRSGW